MSFIFNIIKDTIRNVKEMRYHSQLILTFLKFELQGRWQGTHFPTYFDSVFIKIKGQKIFMDIHGRLIVFLNVVMIKEKN